MSSTASAQPRARLLSTVKAVAWSFLGLRGGQGFEQDVRRLKPLQVVAVGLVGVFVFVGALAALVHWIVPG
jgi:predicted Na+-dependent transporter